jgi:hypothetical protein
MLVIESQREAKRNTLELKVLSMLHQVKFYCENLEQFKREFDIQIELIPRLNTVTADLAYKCIKPTQKILGEPEDRLEIWHVNSTGYYDRLIAKIYFKN